MSVDQACNFKRIHRSLSTSGLLTDKQLGLLGQEGYEVVINLLPEEHEQAIKQERKIVEDQGLDYEYIPVDFSAPTKSDYQQFSEKMRAASNKKLLAHCAANYRVSAFYAIYAFHNLSWPESDVYKFIASIWNLSEYPQWESFVSHMLLSKDG